MLNPQEDEYMIDTAAGSSGFPVHTIFHVWRQILDDEGLQASHLFSLEDKPPRCKEYVEEKVFAIDFDEKAVRVARTLNLIAGDGQTNVLHLNTLDYELWDEITSQEEWDEVYNSGFKRLKRRRPKGSKDYREFQFDVLMANPPFAGDIKEPRMISRYDLAKKPDGKWQTKVGRDILFIERNLDFLKPGGRMAIVLPQGRFNNSSDKNIRDFIAERCRILAVVGLHGNTFKPHTGTKTSVLFVQKWNDDPKVGARCPRQDDYSIFFATMQKSGKDNSGEKIYVKKSDGSGDLLFDEHNHWIVDHDLFNHDGKTEDGIAEAFIEFAKKENLSFFEPSPSVTPFDAVRYQRLMDGLEATDVKYSEILSGASTLRFDSEYYKKEFLADEKILKAKSNQFEKFSHLDLAVDASAFYPSIEPYYGEGDLPFLRVADVNRTIDYNNCVTIPNQLISQHPTLKKVSPGDILLTKGGSVARVGLVTQEAAVSRDLIFIDSAQLLEEDQIYLYLYFQTNFCNRLLLRSSSQSVQAHLTITLVRDLELFKASEPFKFNLKRLVNLGQNQLDSSQEIYQQAEELLLSELGLQNWQPTEETVAVKSFAESFLSSGRLDAEYYQPKYDELEKNFHQFKMLRIREFIKYPVSSGATPKAGGDDYTDEENGIPFIRAVDLKDGRIETSNFIFIKRDVHEITLRKTKVKTNDILFSIAGTVGRCAIFDHEFEANINQAVSILRFDENQFKRLYLVVFFNSKIGKIYVSKYARQGLQTNLNLNEVAELKIPILDWRLQEEISQKVQDSFDVKEKSKQLLEIAKTGVEQAIETNEATATTWITQQLEALNIKLI